MVTIANTAVDNLPWVSAPTGGLLEQSGQARAFAARVSCGVGQMLAGQLLLELRETVSLMLVAAQVVAQQQMMHGVATARLTHVQDRLTRSAATQAEQSLAADASVPAAQITKRVKGAGVVVKLPKARGDEQQIND